MTHWSRQCRCAGISQPATNPAPWCRRDADEEDGMCSYCRITCGGAVLTMEQVQQRALDAAAMETADD